jgi:hypothetical protein
MNQISGRAEAVASLNEPLHFLLTISQPEIPWLRQG